MRPTRAACWWLRHPRTTALAALTAAGVAEPVCWLVAAPAAIWWGITQWPDAVPGRRGDIRAAVLAPGRSCPGCGRTHARTALVGLDGDGQPRCIEPDRPSAAPADDRQETAA